jgi:hypothetical protein
VARLRSAVRVDDRRAWPPACRRSERVLPGQLLHAVHRQQDLQLQADRLQRLAAPCARRAWCQRLLARLQRDLGCTAEQLLVAPRGVSMIW